MVLVAGSLSSCTPGPTVTYLGVFPDPYPSGLFSRVRFSEPCPNKTDGLSLFADGKEFAGASMSDSLEGVFSMYPDGRLTPGAHTFQFLCKEHGLGSSATTLAFPARSIRVKAPYQLTNLPAKVKVGQRFTVGSAGMCGDGIPWASADLHLYTEAPDGTHSLQNDYSLAPGWKTVSVAVPAGARTGDDLYILSYCRTDASSDDHQILWAAQPIYRLGGNRIQSPHRPEH
ncbi:MAG: hypothetical protein JO291_08270 [Acidimicrobiia bacterium]|nr:hypothetical protein [Acidimicrobiia bacterium]